jgi:hypothetical protein
MWLLLPSVRVDASVSRGVALNSQAPGRPTRGHTPPGRGGEAAGPGARRREREEMKEIAQDEIDEVTSVCTVRTDTVAACDHATVWFLIIQFRHRLAAPPVSRLLSNRAAKQSVR